MRQVICLLLVFLLHDLAPAQRPQYTIETSLDTASHRLKGSIKIRYTNQSDQPMDSIGIHLWMNAFNGSRSALVNQQLHLGDLTLYRAEEDDLGRIMHLNFKAEDIGVGLVQHPEHGDIAWLLLRHPLKPGESILLSSPFVVKIPESFSRPGRTLKSYQLTQWYPHIGVHEDSQWQMMPYLDQGEFYNDFADYDVTITTPANYSIAATGELISEERNDNAITRHYKAANVIDFAWFASPSYTHEQKDIRIGDRDVRLNILKESYLHEHWDSAMVYAERAIRFYSDWLGPYPYPQMTVVHTPFSHAGFMEYPMVAQISYTTDRKLLDRVIAHEIGHTWIYGILASNEREHPWMDEGFNSFLEKQYMKRYYADTREIALPAVFHGKHSMDGYDALRHITAMKGKLQPPDRDPQWQDGEQYLYSAYVLPSKGLELMMEGLGLQMMKKMFRQYFEDHAFSHVRPEDARHSFEKICGCDLSWYFNEWTTRSHEIDYRISKIDPREGKVSVRNVSGVKLPVTVTACRSDTVVSTIWNPGFTGDNVISFGHSFDHVRLYDQLSLNRKWKRDHSPASILPVVSLIPKVSPYERPAMSMTPMFGYNRTDGLMPGVTILSDILPQPGWKLLLMPFYGVDSRQFRYYAETRYAADFRKGPLDLMMLSFSASRFGYARDTHYLFRNYFEKFSPGLSWRLRERNPHSHISKWFHYRYVHINRHVGEGINYAEKTFRRETHTYGIHELMFSLSSDTVLQPYRLEAGLQQGEGFLRLNVHYKQHFRGRDKLRGLWVHGFAGWLPYHDDPATNVYFTFNGSSMIGNDYMFDEWLIDRNAVEGNFTRQIFMKDAGLKTLSSIGLSEKWMLGGGASVSLPFKVLHVYMDVAAYHSAITNKPQFSYSGGLSVILMKDVFEIYIPLLESRDIRESLTYVVRPQWYDRISFQANFKLANPFYLLDRWQYDY